MVDLQVSFALLSSRLVMAFSARSLPESISRDERFWIEKFGPRRSLGNAENAGATGLMRGAIAGRIECCSREGGSEKPGESAIWVGLVNPIIPAHSDPTRQKPIACGYSSCTS